MLKNVFLSCFLPRAELSMHFQDDGQSGTCVLAAHLTKGLAEVEDISTVCRGNLDLRVLAELCQAR